MNDLAESIPMVDGLASYLELSVEDARRQWHEVAGRVWKQRQGRLLPVEVLLCYELFFILDPHKYGGGNIHRVPEDVKVLADTLRRTPGSLTSKMLNRDGSRENCARLESELFVRLAGASRLRDSRKAVLPPGESPNPRKLD